jgi:hypothetical protein
VDVCYAFMLVKSSMIRGDHTRDGETSAKSVALFLTAYCVSTEAQWRAILFEYGHVHVPPERKNGLGSSDGDNAQGREKEEWCSAVGRNFFVPLILFNFGVWLWLVLKRSRADEIRAAPSSCRERNDLSGWL